MSSHGGHPVHYLMASTAQMSIPQPNTCNPVGHSVTEEIHAHHTLPGIFTHPQWMLQLTSKGEAIAFH